MPKEKSPITAILDALLDGHLTIDAATRQIETVTGYTWPDHIAGWVDYEPDELYSVIILTDDPHYVPY